MRLKRIKLMNFRGIVERELIFPTVGVTIIEGPNEVGKSTIPEAIDLLFDYRDSSKHKSVESVKPVHTDVGPEVELEFITGEYHVIYHKRWLVKAQTTLRILSPSHENLTGQDAHDRMSTLLSETLDESLWKALRYQQGVSIAQASLDDSHSLAAALDATVTGSGLGGDEEADLFKTVEAERSKYFTQTGKIPIERQKARDELDALHSKICSTTQELIHLETLADDHRLKQLEQANISAEQAKNKVSIDNYRTKWQEIENRQREINILSIKSETSKALERQAKESNDTRMRFIEDQNTQEKSLEELENQLEYETPIYDLARSERDRSKELLDGLRLDRIEKENVKRRAVEDLNYFKNSIDLDTMSERLNRCVEAEKQLNHAEAFLEECSITPELLEQIQEANFNVREKWASLKTENSTLRIQAIQSFELEENSQTRDIALGECIDLNANEELNIVVAKIAQITILPGFTVRQLRDDAHKADADLAMLYEKVGIKGDQTFLKAKELEERRRDAVDRRKNAKKTLKDDLRDLTIASLAEKIERLKEKVANYQGLRGEVLPLPKGLEEAEEISIQAEQELQSTESLVASHQEMLEIRENELGQREKTTTILNTKIEFLEQQLTASQHKLREARQIISDENLADELSRAIESAALAKKQLQAAKQELAATDPEGTKAMLDNALQTQDRAKRELREVEDELTRTVSILETRGEFGLQTNLDELRSLGNQKERERERIDRQANAVSLLYSTLKTHRDVAQRSYVGPFRDQLEELGGIVFGSSLKVELDHTKLKIINRTLDGITLPFDSLSGGAKEQLSLLARIACAALVSTTSDTSSASDAGVPVIIDDALGYSDSKRLERLGTVLSIAGKHSQVIILTCMPERYRNVGSAHTVKLNRE